MSKKVLFINHPEKECGVHQYGENTSSAISQSKEFDFIYCECANGQDLVEHISRHDPVAIIYNYYGSTMPWLSTEQTRGNQIIHIGIIHEVTQERVNTANKTLFDFHIAPDPTVLLTNPIVFKTGRLIPIYKGNTMPPEKLSIGSFGFGTKGKGYTEIIDAVQNEFDEALIRFNIPFARFGDADGQGAHAYAEACKKLITKPGIELKITHDFLSQQEVLEFLASNTLNCFFYDENKNRGISSVIDLALGVDRPIAITKSNMFRHVTHTQPSICIEDSSLRQIISNGTGPLSAYKKEWTPANLCWDYERIIRCAIAYHQPQSARRSRIKALLEKTPARRIFRKLKKIARFSSNKDKLMLAGQVKQRQDIYKQYNISSSGTLVYTHIYNRILDNKAREQYDPVIKLLCQLCSDEMSRKIPEANIQQAFVFETVRDLSRLFNSPRILSVGCYEDTAYMGLLKLGITADGIDPLLNYDLTTFMEKPGVKENKYDIIFSTSVIEHVSDDEKFVKEISELLNPGGYIVFTCDYKQDYKPGDKIPRVDFRFYTKEDLTTRLPKAMKDIEIHGPAEWDCPQPDFWFEKINYTFASFVGKKRS